MQNSTTRRIILAVFAVSILLFAIPHFYENIFAVSVPAGMRLLIDAFIFLLIVSLLYTFYQHTRHADYLISQVPERQPSGTQYLDLLPEGVAIVDTEQQISYLNQAGKALLDLAAAPDNARLLSDWTARFCASCTGVNDPSPAEETLLIDSPVTPLRTLLVQTRPLFDAHGKLVQTITLLRDTSEISRNEIESKRVQKLAEQALAEREIFLANISHDIRTPLNAILGFSELLDQRKTEPDDRTYLEGIRTSGTNLLALINELLDLSRIESGQLTLEPRPVLLDDIVQAVAAEIIPKARRKNVQYRAQVDPDVPSVFMADRLRLTQVLLAIGTHAINFTDEGLITLTVQQRTADPLQGTHLLFTITDAGNDIAADKLEHVFDRFGRVSDQAMYRSGGTGLGLNIARSLVALMGGTISAESHSERGTSFCVGLPVDRADTPAPVLTQTTRTMRPRSIPAQMTVLLVEDNILNQKVMAGYLNRYQLKPTIVNNGLEAIEVLKDRSFDLIFMDIQMPIMDGYLATETIRQQLALTTPIVAMTAYTMAGERERCLLAGMNDYLSKPIHMHQLDNVLARFMPTPVSSYEPTKPTKPVAMGTHVIDEDFLNELMDGDDELLAEMVTLFLQDLPTYRQTLFDSAEQQDHALFKQTAHKFRSSLNSLAMLNTAKSLKVLETDTTPDPLAKRIQLTSLFEEINDGLTFLQNRLA
jgi:signal transduction histidine kinase/CheY-like chemotaxis protein/HPt (histidine-containing phosphotransfer) domain-containing protein